MHQITSLNNPSVKQWKKLHLKKERKKQNTYLIEGFHLVEEAINYRKQDVMNVLIREDLVDDEQFINLDIEEGKVTVINLNIAEELSETERNQGVFAEIKIKSLSFPDAINKPILLLDAVQDPGNVGTMIRTADAAGFQGVFLGEGTVDLYNSKTLRSAQGSHFHLDIYEGVIFDFIQQFKKTGNPVFGTALNKEAESYKEVRIETPFGVVVGNEGAGINEEIIAEMDKNIYIPMHGEAESLNVAIAAGILMFHLSNQ